MDFYIKRFDMRQIHNNNKILFIGKTQTGKSTLIKDLLYHKRKIEAGVCIAGTQEGICDYAKIMPRIAIFDEYDKKIIRNLIKSQRRDEQMNRRHHRYFVMDDCIYDNSWIKHKEMRYMFYNSRHDDILFLLSLQAPLAIPPDLRGNIDYIFILRDSILANRERLWKHYAGMFENFQTFCNVMDQCTENYECLVIKNNCQSNRFEDQVFFYKAELHENFKIGSPEFWKYHKQHYNANYETEQADRMFEETDSDKPKHKKVTKKAFYRGAAG